MGLHCGPCSGAVIGKSRAFYRLFGDTMNTASRLQSHGAPNSVHLSQTAYSAAVQSGFDADQFEEKEMMVKSILG